MYFSVLKTDNICIEENVFLNNECRRLHDGFTRFFLRRGLLLRVFTL